MGMYIRNAFKLWEYKWEPEPDENGVDCSPDHPDAISMRIIEDVWQRINDEFQNGELQQF